MCVKLITERKTFDNGLVLRSQKFSIQQEFFPRSVLASQYFHECFLKVWKDLFLFETLIPFAQSVLSLVLLVDYDDVMNVTPIGKESQPADEKMIEKERKKRENVWNKNEKEK